MRPLQTLHLSAFYLALVSIPVYYDSDPEWLVLMGTTIYMSAGAGTTYGTEFVQTILHGLQQIYVLVSQAAVSQN